MNFLKKLGSSLKKLIQLPFGTVKGSVARIKKVGDGSSIRDALSNPEIRKRILVTLSLILVYRILATVPLPGIDVQIINDVSKAFGGVVATSIFTIITGSRLDNPTVVAIGLGAYINASIVIQLLSSVIPQLEELNKEGERGRRVLNNYTRILAVPLNIVQAIVVFFLLKNTSATVPQLAGILDNINGLQIVALIASLVAGSMVLMWLGELITEYGIGNGTSIIITVGILSILPSLFARDFSFIGQDIQLIIANGNFNVLFNQNFLLLYAILIGTYVLVWAIIYITEASRKVPVNYASRFRNAKNALSNYLPLKINQAGVMPVIFGSALLTFPQILSQLLLGLAQTGTILYNFGTFINNSYLVASSQTGRIDQVIYYEITYFILILGFNFFYTLVAFKPAETADNLKKSGGFIPGIRPGSETQKYITTVILKLALLGGLFLGIVALIPSLVRLTPQGANLAILGGIGGTSILIVVGVISDTIRQMKSLTVTRSYEQFK